MESLDLEARPEAVPQARGFARGVLERWGETRLRDDVDLVLTELLTNAVLHAPGAARVVVDREPGGVRVEVRDTSTTRPLRRASGAAATTGRGLNLVAALGARWGVSGRDDGEPGKAVWCVLVPAARPGDDDGDGDGGTTAGGAAVEDVDLDALLASFGEEVEEPRTAEVHVGEGPTALLREAKDHLDGVLREIALAEGTGGDLPQEVVEPMARAVRRFAEARTQLRALLVGAGERGDARVHLVFRLPVAMAEAGEQYLEALTAADSFARDRRMLSLESPVEHRVLREWYVQGLVAGLRAARDGGPPVVQETFEHRLLRELHLLEQGRRSALLGAQLQQVTARLAAAEALDEIAGIAVAEGVRALGAAGGTLARLVAGSAVPVTEVGADAGTGRRYLSSPVQTRPAGPSTAALTSGEPVWLEGREERDARFPHLAQLQPDAVAIAAVPLRVAGEVVGALRLSWSQPHVFTAEERAFLHGLAGQTGSAVARADALGRLRALRDELERLLRTPGRVTPADLSVLRTLYDDAPVGLAVFDADGLLLRVNETVARVDGVPAADHVGRSLAELALPGIGSEQAALLQQVLDGVLTGGQVAEHEVLVQGARRSRSWRTWWFPVRAEDGAVQAAVAVVLDITAQRRAEERTRRLATLGDRLADARDAPAALEAVADAVVPAVADWAVLHLPGPDGRPRLALVRARDAQAAAALRARVEDAPDLLDAVRAVLATGELHAPPRAPDLPAVAVVPVLAGARAVGTLSLGGRRSRLRADDLALVGDVGRRAGLALEDLQARADALRVALALEAADVGSYDWHLPDRHLEGDARLLRLLDVGGSGDAPVEQLLARLHRDDVPAFRERVRAAVEQGGDLAVHVRLVRRDGAVRWLDVRGRALPGRDGRTDRLVGTVVDVTDRRDSDARARAALEGMGEAFLLLDAQWRFTWVNREAERLLQRSRAALLGRPVHEVFPEVVGSELDRQYRRAVATGRPVRFEQWSAPLGAHVEVRARPGPDGLAVYVADVSDRRAAEHDRDRALARLDLLNRIGEALTATLDVDESLARLADLLVPELADLVAIDVDDRDDVRGARAVVVTAVDPERAGALRRADALLPRRLDVGSAVHRVLHGAGTVHLSVTEDDLRRLQGDDARRALYRGLDVRFAVVAPLAARGTVFGVLSLLRTGPGAVDLSDDDVAFVEEVGRRAGLMVDNARQYTAQREVAEGLQRSLLPELPRVAGLGLGAAYEPSSSAATVGGDWYDAFPLPDGGLGLVIGDVMGHDIAAAAAMGQLRSVLRTCAADGDPPALVLDRLDRLVASFAVADLATVVFAHLDRQPDGGAVLTWANAGHPPPLVLLPDGTTTFLRDGASPMLGVPRDPDGPPREQARVVLPAGSTLLLFTDGVVERRGADLDDQLDDLARTARALRAEVGDLGQLCTGLLARQRAGAGRDDAAAVAVTLEVPDPQGG